MFYVKNCKNCIYSKQNVKGNDQYISYCIDTILKLFILQYFEIHTLQVCSEPERGLPFNLAAVSTDLCCG